ncbi:MAG: multiheme c-type cytochrome [Planctomycetota bacterium]|nr:multiheme c-type cytochrome [Planctomycetota bacterium]
MIQTRWIRTQWNRTQWNRPAQALPLTCILLIGLSLPLFDSTASIRAQDPPPETPPIADDLLGDDLLDDLLEETPKDSPNATEVAKEDAHAKVFAESNFPSADECALCHPTQYREWSVSQHAYSQLSPLMMSMQNAMNAGTSSTNGDFCLRCHAPVGSDMGEPFSISNLDRHPASREGITCVTCHRMSAPYRKISGRLGIDQGDVFDSVKGPNGNQELSRILNDPQTYKVNTDRNDVGRAIHTEVEKFPEISDPAFCGSCHEVFAPNGLKVHELISEYRNSPAAAEGITCNDCHMGKEQGIPSGYAYGPGAVVGGVSTADRKLTNHFFAGPDYSLLHPGIFPVNRKANELKSLAEWLLFDVDGGWGTQEFEDQCPEDFAFAEPWLSIDDREDARLIIDEQLELLDWAKQQRIAILKRGFGLSDIRVTAASEDGVNLEIDVKNLTKGHNLPTGFDAERLFVVQIEVKDARGKLIFASGDRDPNGDVRDSFSLYVRSGEVKLDEQLFNLQSKFMSRNIRGGDREQVLTINNSVTALPFIRPASRPNNIYGHPKGMRKHRRGIEPLGQRTAHYQVDGKLLSGHGPYSVEARFISQAVPVNLIHQTMHVGFDYGLSPRELGRRLVEGAVVVAEKSVVVEIPKSNGEGS